MPLALPNFVKWQKRRLQNDERPCMMLFQGSAAFELWTGEPMPIEYMKETLGIDYDE